MHHIISDGWSVGVLAREIGELYGAMSEGRSQLLPELKIQYADYAAWQRQYLTDQVMEKYLAYWRKQLAGNIQALSLPLARPRPAVPSYRGGAMLFTLPEELSQRLKVLSRQEGVTLFMLLLAAFKTLLHKYTAQMEIIVGTPVANRDRAEIEPLIGFFVNLLPMRTDLGDNPRFRELVRRVKEVALSGYAHQEIPFERLVKEIQPERAVWEMPLFNVVFGVQNMPHEDLGLPGIKIRSMPVELGTARFDLTLWIAEDRGDLQACWFYSKDLFEEEAVMSMHNHFETLLFSIVDRPDARLSILEISDRAETSPVYKGRGALGGCDNGTPAPIRRRGIKLPTQAV